jgi:hypothetical protein
VDALEVSPLAFTLRFEPAFAAFAKARLPSMFVECQI